MNYEINLSLQFHQQRYLLNGRCITRHLRVIKYMMKKPMNIIIRIILSILVFVVSGLLCSIIFSKLRLSLNLDGQIACPCTDGIFECLCYSADAITTQDKVLNILYGILQILIPLGGVLFLNIYILKRKS